MTHTLLRQWLISGLGLLLTMSTVAAAENYDLLRNGQTGFVVSQLKYALNEAGDVEAICPQGTALNVKEIYAMTPEGQRRKGESDIEYGERLDKATWKDSSKGGVDLCMNPEAGAPDPHFKTVEHNDVTVFGIDLDGENASNDFPGVEEGQQGVDNQFYRSMGCSRSYQPSGMSNSFEIGMLSGEWGILIKLDEVDDLKNDASVKVGIYANADPIDLSADRQPLSYATYSIDQNKRFRAETTGSIRDGVLTTEPVDVRFHHVINSIVLERPLRDARLQASINEHGQLNGYLAGYTPVEAMYDMQFGFRNGKSSSGGPAPLRLRSGSANGAAMVLGHTCHGAWQALHKNADGHPDPVTGEFTSISTQYMFKALPAFIVDTESKSINDTLADKMEYVDDY